MTFELSVNTISRTDNRYSRWFLADALYARGGGGILTTIGKVSPFVCLLYSRPFWVRKDYETVDSLMTSIGVELALSPHISFVGRVQPWYRMAEGFVKTDLNIGLNLSW